MTRKLNIRKRIAIVAHDHKKEDLIDWAWYNRDVLSLHELFGTGTTGRLLEEKLKQPVTKLMSGPLGGDQQIGSMIAEGKVDVLIFFWDPMEAQPHDPDIKALAAGRLPELRQHLGKAMELDAVFGPLSEVVK